MHKVVAALIRGVRSLRVFTGQASYAAPVGCDIENNGTGSGTSTITAPGASTFIIDGTIQATALGPGTFHGEGVQTGPTTFTYSGTRAVSGRHGHANGRRHQHRFQHHDRQSTPSRGEPAGSQGCTGTSVITTVSSSTSDPQVSAFTLTFTGTVHFAHGHCGQVTGTTSGTTIIDSATGTGPPTGPSTSPCSARGHCTTTSRRRPKRGTPPRSRARQSGRREKATQRYSRRSRRR